MSVRKQGGYLSVQRKWDQAITQTNSDILVLAKTHLQSSKPSETEPPTEDPSVLIYEAIGNISYLNHHIPPLHIVSSETKVNLFNCASCKIKTRTKPHIYTSYVQWHRIYITIALGKDEDIVRKE